MAPATGCITISPTRLALGTVFLPARQFAFDGISVRFLFCIRLVCHSAMHRLQCCDNEWQNHRCVIILIVNCNIRGKNRGIPNRCTFAFKKTLMPVHSNVGHQRYASPACLRQDLISHTFISLFAGSARSAICIDLHAVMKLKTAPRPACADCQHIVRGAWRVDGNADSRYRLPLPHKG